jgi:hypothetical protein
MGEPESTLNEKQLITDVDDLNAWHAIQNPGLGKGFSEKEKNVWWKNNKYKFKIGTIRAVDLDKIITIFSETFDLTKTQVLQGAASTAPTAPIDRYTLTSENINEIKETKGINLKGVNAEKMKINGSLDTAKTDTEFELLYLGWIPETTSIKDKAVITNTIKALFRFVFGKKIINDKNKEQTFYAHLRVAYTQLEPEDKIPCRENPLFEDFKNSLEYRLKGVKMELSAYNQLGVQNNLEVNRCKTLEYGLIKIITYLDARSGCFEYGTEYDASSRKEIPQDIDESFLRALRVAEELISNKYSDINSLKKKFGEKAVGSAEDMLAKLKALLAAKIGGEDLEYVATKLKNASNMIDEARARIGQLEKRLTSSSPSPIKEEDMKRLEEELVAAKASLSAAILERDALAATSSASAGNEMTLKKNILILMFSLHRARRTIELLSMPGGESIELKRIMNEVDDKIGAIDDTDTKILIRRIFDFLIKPEGSVEDPLAEIQDLLKKRDAAEEIIALANKIRGHITNVSIDTMHGAIHSIKEKINVLEADLLKKDSALKDKGNEIQGRMRGLKESFALTGESDKRELAKIKRELEENKTELAKCREALIECTKAKQEKDITIAVLKGELKKYGLNDEKEAIIQVRIDTFVKTLEAAEEKDKDATLKKIQSEIENDVLEGVVEEAKGELDAGKDAAKAELDAAKAELDAAKAELDAAKAELDAAKADAEEVPHLKDAIADAEKRANAAEELLSNLRGKELADLATSKVAINAQMLDDNTKIKEQNKNLKKIIWEALSNEMNTQVNLDDDTSIEAARKKLIEFRETCPECKDRVKAGLRIIDSLEPHIRNEANPIRQVEKVLRNINEPLGPLESEDEIKAPGEADPEAEGEVEAPFESDAEVEVEPPVESNVEAEVESEAEVVPEVKESEVVPEVEEPEVVPEVEVEAVPEVEEAVPEVEVEVKEPGLQVELESIDDVKRSIQQNEKTLSDTILELCTAKDGSVDILLAKEIISQSQIALSGSDKSLFKGDTQIRYTSYMDEYHKQKKPTYKLSSGKVMVIDSAQAFWGEQPSPKSYIFLETPKKAITAMIKIYNFMMYSAAFEPQLYEKDGIGTKPNFPELFKGKIEAPLNSLIDKVIQIKSMGEFSIKDTKTGRMVSKLTTDPDKLKKMESFRLIKQTLLNLAEDIAKEVQIKITEKGYQKEARDDAVKEGFVLHSRKLQTGGANTSNLCDTLLTTILLELSENEEFNSQQLIDKAIQTLDDIGQYDLILEVLNHLIDEQCLIKRREGYTFSTVYIDTETAKALVQSFNSRFNSKEKEMFKTIGRQGLFSYEVPEEYQNLLGTHPFFLVGTPTEDTSLHGVIDDEIFLTNEERAVLEESSMPLGGILFLYVIMNTQDKKINGT